jgi:MFS family permease
MTESEAVKSVFIQLREGLVYIRDHKEVRWSLIYLATTASLVGVLGVLGPSFAETTLGLKPEDFVVVVLPLGIGVVVGILVLNAYGRLVPRRRVIEASLVALGIFLAAIAGSGQISNFISRASSATALPDFSAVTSLLALVVGFAFFAGIAYAFVAIPSQTQLQEDLPSDVRGRVFGVLNMLVSVASFAPILIVGTIAELIGTTAVFLLVGLLVGVSGIGSILIRGHLAPEETVQRADVHGRDPIVSALGAELPEGAYDIDDDEHGTAAATGDPPVGAPAVLDTVAAAGPYAAAGSDPLSVDDAGDAEDAAGRPAER